MEELLNDMVNDQVAKINHEKGRLIAERLYPLAGPDFDIEKESKRTFPRLVKTIYYDKSEHWIWNDGSEMGVEIIVFYEASPVYDHINQKISVTLKYK